MSGDTRSGVPFKQDGMVLVYLGTIACEQGRRAIIDPADVRRRLDVGWSMADIRARVKRVARSTFEMPDSVMPCPCPADECKGVPRQIRVSEGVHVCQTSGLIRICFTQEFMIEARSGAPLDLGMVRKVTRTPALLSFLASLMFLDRSGSATELPVFGNASIGQLMQLPKSDTRARQAIRDYARALSAIEGCVFDLPARSDTLRRTPANGNADEPGRDSREPLTDTSGPSTLPAGHTGPEPAECHAGPEPPAGYAEPEAPHEPPTSHNGRARVAHRASSAHRADLDRWLSAALTGDFEPRTSPREPAAEPPPWHASAGRASPATPATARGKPAPPPAAPAPPPDPRLTAAADMLTLTGWMCAMGFMPAIHGQMQGGQMQGPPNGATQERASGPQRSPPPRSSPGSVVEIDGLRFVDRILVDAPWLNKSRALPRRAPPQAPARREPRSLPPGRDPPSGDDEPDTS